MSGVTEDCQLLWDKVPSMAFSDLPPESPPSLHHRFQLMPVSSSIRKAARVEVLIRSRLFSSDEYWCRIHGHRPTPSGAISKPGKPALARAAEAQDMDRHRGRGVAVSAGTSS
uniref:Uncharacterized protein n=1 Tax=Arundo donax TaxID=35708 RepID=A0A0A9A969_ARUDO